MSETPKSFEERGDGKRNVPSVTTYGLTPQTAAVPARQDAVPEKEKIAGECNFPNCDCEGTKPVCPDASTQPTQAAVGEGALPKEDTVRGWCSSCDKIHELARPECPNCGDWIIFARDSVIVESSNMEVEDVLPARPVKMALTSRSACRGEDVDRYVDSIERQLREAIAQRDEATKESENLRRALAEAEFAILDTVNSAALDVPKPESEEIERLDSMVSKLSGPMFRQERRSLDAEFHGAVRKLLTRLRSLPSEPAGNRKAVEK